jgi:cobalt ECF transporter T component CbiQ
MRSAGFWAHTARDLEKATAAVMSGRIGSDDGWAQRLDPRAKVVAFLILTSTAASLKAVPPLCVLLGASVILALTTGIPARLLIRKAWCPALVLVALLALPLALIQPGDGVVGRLGPTEESLLLASGMVLRVLAASTFCCILIATTRWNVLLKALRLLGAPAVLVSVVSLAFRYVVYLLRTAQEMFEAAESRRIGRLSGANYRRHLAAQIGVLTGKTVTMSDSVYLAMLARGYRGDVRVIDHFVMAARDWLVITSALLFAAALFVCRL